MNHGKKALLLINTGSPDSYKVSDVRKYLAQFLMDGRVINIPAFLRFILVYGIIVPFRAPKSAAKYKEIWTEKGSPLIQHSFDFKEKLQKKLGADINAFVAMRYGKPGINKVLNEIKSKRYGEIIIAPMYPQYASSTTGSSMEYVMRKIAKWETIPAIKSLYAFWQDELYQKAFTEQIKKENINSYDHVLFSFHGLPLKQVYESHQGISCDKLKCTTQTREENQNCYQQTSYRLAESLAEKTGITKEKYTVCFQSRFSRKWLSPFTDQILIKLALSGKRKVLIVCPSFVADCLETIHEVSIEYKKLFKEHGGESLHLIPALNSDDLWVENFHLTLSDLLDR